MSWHRGLREKVREFLTACVGPDWPGRAAQAQRLLDALPSEADLATAGRRGAAEPPPRPGRIDKSALPFAPRMHERQRTRAADAVGGIGVLRQRVLARARGRCEFRCAVPGEPTDAHHVLGGADRRSLESEFTLAAVCEECHGRCNASPAWAREQGLAWARRMADDARAAGDETGVAGFTATAELLEGRVALAAAQARPLVDLEDDPA